jgi:hypothetical protein
MALIITPGIRPGDFMSPITPGMAGALAFRGLTVRSASPSQAMGMGRGGVLAVIVLIRGPLFTAATAKLTSTSTTVSTSVAAVIDQRTGRQTGPQTDLIFTTVRNHETELRIDLLRQLIVRQGPQITSRTTCLLIVREMSINEMPAATGSNVTMDSGLGRKIWTGRLRRCRLPGHHNPLCHNPLYRDRHSNRQRALHSNRRLDHLTIHGNDKTAVGGRGNKQSGRSWSAITVRASMAHSARRIFQVNSEADRADSDGGEASAARSLVGIQRRQRLRRLLSFSLQIAPARRLQTSSHSPEVAVPLGIAVDAGAERIDGRRKRFVAIS